jgi:Pathogenicity locus
MNLVMNPITMSPDEKAEVVGKLRKIPSVSEKAAEGLYDLGIRRPEDLKGKDPVALYEELRNKPGCYCEPCMLNQFKIAVKMAEKG